MEVIVSEQLIGILASFGIGIVAGLLYSIADFLFYLIFGSKNTAENGHKVKRVTFFLCRFISDLSLSVIYALLFTLVSYAHFYGKIRLINIFSFGLGAVLYRAFLFRPVSFVLCRLSNIVRTFMLYMFGIVLSPLGIIFKLFARFSVFIFDNTILKFAKTVKVSRQNKKTDRIIKSLASTVRFN